MASTAQPHPHVEMRFREYKGVRQEVGGRRRLFESPVGQLMIWYDAGEVVSGFQLTYRKPSGEFALTWRPKGGFMHQRVDGTKSFLAPLLRELHPVVLPELVRRFSPAWDGLEPQLLAIILGAFSDCAGGGPES